MLTNLLGLLLGFALLSKHFEASRIPDWLPKCSTTFRSPLALKQGGYDWRYIAYAVGFGGSMIWFGSSTGVALSDMYPDAKNAIGWVRGGWHVTVAYVIGFMIMLAMQGWYPQPKHQAPSSSPVAKEAPSLRATMASAPSP